MINAELPRVFGIQPSTNPQLPVVLLSVLKGSILGHNSNC